MKLPPEVRAQLERRFAGAHRDWLGDAGAGGKWPLNIALGTPTEQQAMREVDAVRAWVAAWRNWDGAGELGWVQRQWKVLGAQRLPASLTLRGPLDVARWIGQDERWARAHERHALLAARWPQLGQRLGSLFGALADYAPADFARLQGVLDWLMANPASNLYPRQIPVAGADSKWLEGRKALLGELLAALRGLPLSEAADFHSLCGLRKPAALVRLRILDPALRRFAGNLEELAAPVAGLARLHMPAPSVLIVENLQTGLALPDMAGTVAVMALGYGVDVLGQLPWVAASRCLYWGDLDTHGFAILNRARAALPRVESVLMDEATLRRHAALWSEEKVQHPAAVLPLLSASEAAVFSLLKQNALGHHIRLEQERVEWDHACAMLEHARGPHPHEP